MTNASVVTISLFDMSRKVSQAQLGIRLPQWLADAIVDAANNKNTTPSNFVRHVLTQAVTAGMLTTTPLTRINNDDNPRDYPSG